jgi:hypothetical protein
MVGKVEHHLPGNRVLYKEVTVLVEVPPDTPVSSLRQMAVDLWNNRLRAQHGADKYGTMVSAEVGQILEGGAEGGIRV